MFNTDSGLLPAYIVPGHWAVPCPLRQESSICYLTGRSLLVSPAEATSPSLNCLNMQKEADLEIPHPLSGGWYHYYTRSQPFFRWMNILFTGFITVNDPQSQEPHAPGLGRVHIILKFVVSWSKAEASSSPTPIHKGVSSLRLWGLLSSWWGWNIVWSANVSWRWTDRLEQARPLPDAGKDSISGNIVWRMFGGDDVPAWTESKTAAGASCAWLQDGKCLSCFSSEKHPGVRTG